MSAYPLCDPDSRIVIAHRGGAGRAPENTLAAFERAASLGSHALELDVRLSRDGEVVVIHDPAVDRTTDRNGPVRELTARELAAVDAGFHFSPDGGLSFPFRGRGVCVPRLADVIEATNPVPLLIEIKTSETLRPTVDLLDRMGATDRSVVAAMSIDAVAPARGGKLRTGAAAKDAAALLFALRLPAALPFEALCIPPRYFGLPVPVGFLARRARRLGAATHVWTINDPAHARRLWRAGVAGIVTDFPDLMAAELARL